MREQVAELTGRRFLGNFTDDEAQFRALLNAGVAFGQAYQLIPGVSLTGAQMAALTSDIIWMVAREVQLADGSVQKVLVPQLYALVDQNQSASASGLISAGGNINAQLTGNLFNTGTLAARGNLAISAADITNMVGTLQAGNNLSLQASGGITSILGQIQARQNLNMSSGGTTLIQGGGISAGGSASLSAGGNFLLLAYDTGRQVRAQSPRDENGNPIGKGPVFSFENSTYNQTGVNVNIGGGLSINAGGNIIAQGTQASVGGNTSLNAGESISITSALNGHVNISSVQNSYSTWGGLGSTTTNEVHNNIDVTNTAATLGSGGSVSLTAGKDIALQGVQINSQGYSASAGGNYSETAAYDIKDITNISTSTSSFLGIKGQNNATDIDLTRTATVTTINAGAGEVSRTVGGNALIEGSIVSGAVVNPLTAGGSITVQAAVDTRHIEHTTLTSNGIWQSTESKGEIQQTLHMPQIHGTIPQGMSAYQGAGGVSIQLPKGSDLRQAIEAASQQPGGEYIAGLAQRSDIDWSQVEAINKTWDYKQEGLTPEAALIVSVIVTIATSGTVQTWAGALPGGAAAAGSTGLSALGASYAAGMSALASTATVSLINNKGDIGAVLSELTSPANLQNLAVTMLTAGATQGLLGGLEIGGKPFGSINAASPFIDQLGKNILQGITNATVISAVTGQSYSDALAASLTSAFINTVGAQGANLIGDNGASLGPLGKDIAHALLGCAIGSATAGNSSGCAPGATGAVVGEMVAQWYGNAHGLGDLEAQRQPGQDNTAIQAQIDEIRGNILDLSRLVGLGSGLLVGGDVATMNIAMGTSVNAAQNNFLNHAESSERMRLNAALMNCNGDQACKTSLNAQIAALNTLDKWRDDQKDQACASPSSALCLGWNAALQIAAQSYVGQPTNSSEVGERTNVIAEAERLNQAVNNPYSYGIGKGLLGLTPPVLVAGLGVGAFSATQHVLENGWTQSGIDAINGMANLPADFRARLTSDDPTIRGEAMVGLLALGAGATAVTVGGVRVTMSAFESRQVASALAREEALAISRARIENNFYAEGASSNPVGLNASAGIIRANPNKTTTVLGRYTPDMDSAINVQMHAAKTEDFGARPGGFNVLNVDDVTAASSPNFFEQYNVPFLNEAVKRGDDIALATIPVLKADVIDLRTGALKGNFAKELDYLVKNDYKPVNISASQWNSIKGWFR